MGSSPSDDLAAEVRDVRFFARASLWTWAIALGLLWLHYALDPSKGARKAVLTISLFAFFGAVLFTAKFIYHGSTVWVTRLSREYQCAAQVIIAIAAALVPAWFFGSRTTHEGTDLIAYVLSNVWMLATTVAYGAAVYYLAKHVRPMLPLRAYLVVVAVTAVFALVGPHLGDGGEDAWGAPILGRDEVSDPDLRFVNYVRFIAAGYLGVTLALLRHGTSASPRPSACR